MLTVLEKKKRGYGQKNKLEEIDKPRGFDRNLPIDRILGATDCKGDLMFLIKWIGCDEYDLLPVREINEKDPATVIAYYEERSPIVRKCIEKATFQEEFDNGVVDPPNNVVEMEENVADVAETVDESTESAETAAGVVSVESDVPISDAEAANVEELGTVDEVAESVAPIPEDN